MRTFYEEWSDVFEESSNSALASAELPSVEFRHLQVPKFGDVASDDFCAIGFTHHRTILENVKDLDERIFYIKEAARNHFSVETLKRAIREDDYHHQGALPNNFLRSLTSEEQAFRAVNAFKDEYLLDFINIEELGARCWNIGYATRYGIHC